MVNILEPLFCGSSNDECEETGQGYLNLDDAFGLWKMTKPKVRFHSMRSKTKTGAGNYLVVKLSPIGVGLGMAGTIPFTPIYHNKS